MGLGAKQYRRWCGQKAELVLKQSRSISGNWGIDGALGELAAVDKQQTSEVTSRQQLRIIRMLGGIVPSHLYPGALALRLRLFPAEEEPWIQTQLQRNGVGSAAVTEEFSGVLDNEIESEAVPEYLWNADQYSGVVDKFS